ncbi:MAG: VWA domain-containing protein [Myxococcota bacterium]
MNVLAPTGFLLALIGLPLVAMYFLRIRRRRVPVSSLLPWHNLRRTEQLASPFQRFRNHWLLWLQLLILAALVLALVRPFMMTAEAPFASRILVIDTSASMAARDGDPTRLDTAVGFAQDLVERLGPEDEALLVVAGPTTEVRVPFTRDHGEIRRALGRLDASEAEGSLREALLLAQSLARSRSDVEVVVFSDGGRQDLSTLDAAAVPVRFVVAGTTAHNAGILALDIRRSVVSDLERQLYVTVQHFGPEPVQGAVEVTLDGRLLGVRSEPLPSDVPVGLVFDLPAEQSGELVVRLDVPDDPLAADDVAHAILDPLGRRNVVVVGGDALIARILASDPRVDGQVMSPGLLDLDRIRQADCVLFAGPVPDGVDGLSYAVLGPYPGGPLRFGEEVVAPDIISWRRDDPLLRFTRWDNVFVGKARAIQDTAGLVPLVEGEGGPLLLAGRHKGGRVVQMAFDPLQSDLPLRVAWPVLLLNMVGWLTDDPGRGAPGAMIRTGQPWVVPVGGDDLDEIVVVGPKGRATVPVVGGTARFTGLHHLGRYDARGGGRSWQIAANLLSEAESRIAPRKALGLGSAPVAASSSLATARREFWRPLLWLGLLVLSLEWALYHRRRTA